MNDITQSKWDAGKQEHIALSNAAAGIYNEFYANANFATRLYMEREEEVIREVSGLAMNGSVAVDLGSGTGRDSLVLAKKFDQVFGYEISINMVDEAEKYRLQNLQGNVAFKLLDVENESLPHADASVGLVNSGFGMGSFLETPSNVMREVRRILSPQGYAIFSFYNRDAALNQIPVEWEPSLAAVVDAENETIKVTLSNGDTHFASAKAYTVDEVRKMLDQFFNVVSIETYPTVSSLLPKEFFNHPLAEKLLTEVDHILSSNKDFAAGHYIIAVCQKAGRLVRSESSRGYRRAFELINREGLSDDIQRHAPIKTMNDAEAAIGHLGVTKDKMLKSVLITTKDGRSGLADNPMAPPPMWLLVTQADKTVSFKKVAEFLDLPRAQLELAKMSILEDFTGFSVGAVPPFAMPKNVPVIFDEPIKDLGTAWCGTGDPSQSLKVSIETLVRMAAASYCEITKMPSDVSSNSKTAK